MYQGKLLKLLGFYLNETTSNTTKYLIIDQVMPFLVLLKRELLELSHPHLNIDCMFGEGDKEKANGVRKDKGKALIYRHPELMANYLIVISKLVANNKHT